jgi:tetratricopeptide (TPR) repeat protein
VSETFTLRLISKAAIPQAMNKAERYRLLNDPEQAESICLDVLATEPDNQQALVVLILAMTDQFGNEIAPAVQQVREYLGRLADEYQRHYYEGLVYERQGRACLQRPMGWSFAYDRFRSAMTCYEQADALSPVDDDEAILRWNSCVRTIQRAHLEPRPAEMEQPLE